MARATPPLYANERTAAKLLDMTPSDFRRLVGAGALPPPIDLHGFTRWRVADLEAIASGAAMDEDFAT